MKILHVIPELDERVGGPPRSLATLARAQADRGDDVLVLGCRRSSGPATIPVGTSGKLTVLEPPGDSGLLWYDRAVKRAIFDAAKDRNIIHVHGTWRYHSLASSAAARAHGIPLVLRPFGNLGVESRGRAHVGDVR